VSPLDTLRTPNGKEVARALSLLEDAEMVGKPLTTDEARHCGWVVKALDREVKSWVLTEQIRNDAGAREQMERFVALMRAVPCTVCGSRDHNGEQGHEVL